MTADALAQCIAASSSAVILTRYALYSLKKITFMCKIILPATPLPPTNFDRNQRRFAKEGLTGQVGPNQ